MAAHNEGEQLCLPLTSGPTEPAIADVGAPTVPITTPDTVGWPVDKAAPRVRKAPRSSMKDWPRADRPRDKLLDRGPSVLSDAELLAILLRTGVRGCSALDQARAVMEAGEHDWRRVAALGAGDLSSLAGPRPHQGRANSRGS